MRMKFDKKRVLSRAAALALAALVAVPAFGTTAFAAEGDTGLDGHQHVISDDNEDPALRHGDDCRQELNGVIIAPGEDGWKGHNDMFCFKTGLDMSSPEYDPDDVLDAVDGEDEGEEALPAEDGGAVHDGDCFQRDALTCGMDGVDGHVHDRTCYSTGWVDETPGMSHSDEADLHVPHMSSPKAQTNASAMLANAGLAGNMVNLFSTDSGIAPVQVSDGIELQSNGGEVDYGPLPATGGAGTGTVLLLGMSGAIAGAAVLYGMRRREDF